MQQKMHDAIKRPSTIVTRVFILIAVSISILFTVSQGELGKALHIERPTTVLRQAMKWTEAYHPGNRFSRLASPLAHAVYCLPLLFAFLLIVPFIEHIYSGMLRLGHLCARHEALFLFLISVISLSLLLFTALFILQDFPNSADEYANIFQAKVFLGGSLWAPPHPLRKFFGFYHILVRNGKMFTTFPPGWPLVLAAALLLKVPLWLVNPLIGALSLAALFFLGKKLYGGHIGAISAVVMLASPFFIFNSSSYFMHTLCSALVLLFVYFCLRFCDKEKKWPAFLSGVFFGLAFITRPYTALLCALPSAFYLLPRLRNSSNSLRMIAWFFTGALPPVLFLLIFNYCITGNALLLPVMTLKGYNKCWSFFRVLEFWTRLLRLHIAEFIKWTPPFLLLIYTFSLPAFFRKGRHFLIESIFCVLVIGHLFYAGTGGNQYGPRYYYEGFPFLVLCVIGPLFKDRQYRDKNLLSRVFFLLFAFSLLWNIPMAIRHFREEQRVIFERREPYRLVEAEKVKNAIVFLKTGSGQLRRMPARDLTRNEADFSNSVLYALDRGAENTELMQYYPDRNYYTYYFDPEIKRGFLKKY